MNLFRRRRDLIAPLLLLSNAGLALVLLAGLQGASDLPAPPPAASPSDGARDEPPPIQFALPPMDAYSETLLRPLFNMTRRPMDDEVGPASAEGDFILSGVVVTPLRKEVLLLSKRDKAVLRGGEGDWLGGWKVMTIEPERVVLRRGTREAELPLERPAGGAAKPAAKAAQPVQPEAAGADKK